MSLNERGYLHQIDIERTKLHDATNTTIEVKSKPQQEKLCTFCKRDMMQPYLRPSSRFIDENGLDNGGMKPDHWYWKCPTCGEHHLMPAAQDSSKKGYKTKHTVISKIDMHLGTYDVHKQSWDGRNRKRRPGQLSDDDNEELAQFGYGGRGGYVVNETTRTMDESGNWY